MSMASILKNGTMYWVISPDEEGAILLEVCNTAQEAFDYCVEHNLQPIEVYIP